MSNFKNNANLGVTFTEPEGTSFYRGSLEIIPEYPSVPDKKGLCLTAFIENRAESVSLGVKTEAEVRELLYHIAVQSRLIEDGEPLVVLKKGNGSEVQEG